MEKTRNYTLELLYQSAGGQTARFSIPPIAGESAGVSVLSQWITRKSHMSGMKTLNMEPLWTEDV